MKGVDKLIKRGALRWLRDAKGHIPFDVADERGVAPVRSRRTSRGHCVPASQ